MARRVTGWDAVRAWSYLRRSKAYRTAWKRYQPQPGLPEQAPSPLQLQTSVDLAAMAWGMLAWEVRMRSCRWRPSGPVPG